MYDTDTSHMCVRGIVFSEVSVTYMGSQRSYICVLGVSCLVKCLLFSYRETHKKSNAIFNCQVGTFYKKNTLNTHYFFLEQINFL
jgi:hypothetical protein